MHARRATCSILLIALVATACSSGAKPKTIRTTVTQTVTATPGGQAASKADGGLKMGTKKSIIDAENDINITVEATEYQQPYKGPQPQKPEDFQGGDIWATVNVKLCNIAGGDIQVSQSPWSLAYKDGTSIETTGSSGGDMPKPEFPMDKTVKEGRCAAGLIAFPVPSGKHPERVVYEPDGTDPTEWALPKV
ncbi:DUF4352 domain-containing protein [Streptomyces mirabilis]|uniref:DUF4352 domain-containing protein n=1 Tax=Streptomyces mirabilis TaxID=68239 RepID=UPI0036B48B4B